jgi:hypothetical protein
VLAVLLTLAAVAGILGAAATMILIRRRRRADAIQKDPP